MQRGDVNTKGELCCVFGMPNTGKTYFLQSLFGNSDRTVVFDTVSEYPENRFHVYRPERITYPKVNKELNELIQQAFGSPQTNDTENPARLIVDEANRSLPNGKSAGEQMENIIGMNTHYNPPVSCWFACRRPTMLNTDIKELSRYWFIFSGGRKNDTKYYDNINPKINDLLKEKDQYQFVLVDRKRNAELYERV